MPIIFHYPLEVMHQGLWLVLHLGVNIIALCFSVQVFLRAMATNQIAEIDEKLGFQVILVTSAATFVATQLREYLL